MGILQGKIAVITGRK